MRILHVLICGSVEFATGSDHPHEVRSTACHGKRTPSALHGDPIRSGCAWAGPAVHDPAAHFTILTHGFNPTPGLHELHTRVVQCPCSAPLKVVDTGQPPAPLPRSLREGSSVDTAYHSHDGIPEAEP